MKDTAPITKPAKKKTSVVTTLSSLKLTIWLLLIIAMLSILGTIIPQQGGVTTFHTHLSPMMFKLFHVLQLFDVYHSYWFLSLIGLLCVNLILCTFKRMPSVLRSFRKAPSYDIPKSAVTVTKNVSPEQSEILLKRLEQAIRFKYGRVSREENQDTITLFARRDRYRRIVLMVAHLSILIIILGMTIGRYTGVEGYIDLPEGESTDTIYLNNPGGILDLGFTLRCDKFTVDFYKNGMPKEFLSELSFIEDGHTTQHGSLRVNYPLTYRGFRFYQANYSTDFSALLDVASDKGNQSITLSSQNIYTLDDQQTTIRALRVEDDFMRMGPAIQLEVSGPSRKEIIWVFKNINEIISAIPDLFGRAPQFNPALYEPYVFSLRGLNPVYKTGLMVARDPGAIIVAVGSFLFFLGIFISLLSPHKKIWTKLHDNVLTIAVQGAGSSLSSDREIRQILQKTEG